MLIGFAGFGVQASVALSGFFICAIFASGVLVLCYKFSVLGKAYAVSGCMGSVCIPRFIGTAGYMNFQPVIELFLI
jgi:hypothetical protein